MNSTVCKKRLGAKYLLLNRTTICKYYISGSHWAQSSVLLPERIRALWVIDSALYDLTKCHWGLAGSCARQMCDTRLFMFCDNSVMQVISALGTQRKKEIALWAKWLRTSLEYKCPLPWSFIHSTKLFIEHLLCPKHCAKCWKYTEEQVKYWSLCSWS